MTTPAHDTLAGQADALSRQFAAGELSATSYREMLLALKARHAATADDASPDIDDAPPTPARRPVNRPAPSAAPKARSAR